MLKSKYFNLYIVIQPMEVDENVSLAKPKAPVKPSQEPEDVSLTHKTPAEIQPTVCIHFRTQKLHDYIDRYLYNPQIHFKQEGEAEAQLKVKKPEIVEEKTIKRPSPKDKDTKVGLNNTLPNIHVKIVLHSV